MRKLLIFVVTLLLLVLIVNNADSAVQGTKHDLSVTGAMTNVADTETRICVFCHSPHPGEAITPLWNHVTNTTGSYGVYDSPTFDADTDIQDIATGGMNASLQCMSCHDGTVGVNELFNPPGAANPTMGSGTELNASGQILPTETAYLGTDLTDDHPVNFNYQFSYDAEVASGANGLKTPASVSNENLLIDGKVQCASCHDPHDQGGFSPFLRKNPAASALCIFCHDK